MPAGPLICAIFRRLLVEIEGVLPLLVRQRRDGAADRLPLGDAEPAFGQPGDAADHDHQEDQPGNEQQPVGDARQGRPRSSAAARFYASRQAYNNIKCTPAERAVRPGEGRFHIAARYGGITTACQQSRNIRQCDIVTCARRRYILAMSLLAIPTHRLDRMAIGLSGLCLVHCLATTVLLAAGPAAGSLLGAPMDPRGRAWPWRWCMGAIRFRPRHPGAWLFDAQRGRRPWALA